MRRFLRRLTSLLCILSICSNLFFSIALSGNTDTIDQDKVAPEHDISVMSFNVLEYEGTGVYAQPVDRGPMVVQTIASFLPDIIGIQEAADARNLNGNFDWNDYLVTELGKLGYSCRYLTQEEEKPSTMTIGAGLMIFFKSERFDLLDHGSALYVSDGKNGTYAEWEGFSRVDSSRYYHYVKLWDKVHQNHLYTFNTHLSVPVSSLKNSDGTYATKDQRTMLANITRTKQAEQLATAMEEMGGNCPVFATGDYNSSWNTSKADDPNCYQLRKMTDSGTFAAASDMALEQISYFPDSLIDHVFFNTRYNFALTYRGAYEEYGGYQPSDHKAMVAYFNYCSPMTFDSGSYDAEHRTFTDTTDQSQYSFSVKGLPTGISYKVFDQFGSEVGNTVSLQQPLNQYTLKFYSSTCMTDDTLPFFTVNATIHCTTATPLSLEVSGAKNCYYTNGAYYVPVDQDTQRLYLSSTDGEIFTDADCTTLFSGVFQNLNDDYTLYLKGNNFLPIYIIRETETASPKTLYVDARIGSADGIVAYTDHRQTILGKAGVNAFGTIKEAAEVANTADGYTILIAPGTYDEGTVTFTKNVNLLGNNDGISPLVRTDAHWTRSTARKSETVICGGFEFTKKSSLSFAVRGFTFYSRSKVHNAIAQTYSNTSATCTMDVAQNIFDFVGNNTVNSSCIYSNNATKTAGMIFDNFFDGSADTPTTMTRVATIRNPKGIVFEQNYMINFTDQFMYLVSEISGGNLAPGNCDAVFRYNRFANCVAFYIHTPTVTKDTTADIQFLYNDFVECGNQNSDYAIKIYISHPNTTLSDLSKHRLIFFGNRFIGCQRAIYLRRNSTESDLRLATIQINHNRFIGMHQSRSGYAMHLCFDIADDNDIEATSENWSFSHNYFASDTVDGNDPASFVTTTFTYNNEAVNSVDPALLYPYYTNPKLTQLSSSEAPKLTDISVTSTFMADGKPHSIIVNAPKNAHISYSTDNENTNDTRAWSTRNPTATLPSRTNVYYMVECPGYQTYYGVALLQIKAANRTLTFNSERVAYDGNPHSLHFDALENDTIQYTYNGVTTAEMPSFTLPGQYTVQIRVANPIYNTATATAILTITSLPLTEVALQGGTYFYDGKPHSPTLTTQTGNETVLYSVNDGKYVETLPAFTEIGSYTIIAKFSQIGYETTYRTATLEIIKRVERSLTVSNFAGVYDGKPHSITVVSSEGDKLQYAIGDGEFTDTLPTFTEVGTYKITVKATREHYEPLQFTATVTITQEPIPNPLALNATVKIDTQGVCTLKVTPILTDVDIVETGDFLLLEYGTDTTIEQCDTGIQNFLGDNLTFTAPNTNTGVYLRYRYDGIVYEIQSPIYK